MSAFNPTIRIIDPPLPADALGDALVRSLNRTPIRALWWEAGLTAAAGMVSLGFVPLVFQGNRFIYHCALERNQWRHVAEWLATVARLPAQSLERASERDRPAATAIIAAILALVLAAAALGVMIGLKLDWIDLSLWGWRSGVSLPAVIFTAAMLLGYLLLYATVLQHHRAAGNTVQEFNHLAGGTVSPPGFDFGVHGNWLVGAVALLLLGLPWGVPMMLAAGAQRGYTTRSSVSTRAAVAARLLELTREHNACHESTSSSLSRDGSGS